MKPWFLYLLECVDGSIYTGITTDVEARFRAHQSGKGARYTRSHPPIRILASFSYPDRSSASKAEYQVKRLTTAQKQDLICNPSQANALKPDERAESALE